MVFLFSTFQLPTTVCKDDYIHEVCRYGGSELHAIASIIGGCAAQEAIKLITKQYVPVNNLFIYNAIKSETIVLKV
jgi:amyloid beta precursor protein binding protein 1